MSDDNDTDLPALTETAVDTDDAGGANEPTGYGDAPIEPGHGPRYRAYSDKTRKLFADAAATLKQQFDDGADADDLEPAITTAPAADAPAAAVQGAPAQPAATATAPQGTPPPPPPAPSLSPATDNRQAITLEAREKALADREAALVKRESVQDAVASLRDRYLDSPAEAIVDAIKLWTGIDSDGELGEELTDMVTHLSAKIGVAVPGDIKARLDAKRATRAVKAWKSDAAKREAELAKKAEDERMSAEEKRRDEMGRNALAQHLPALKGPDGKHPYQFLMLEDDPASVLWGVVKEQYVRAGKPDNYQPDLAAAAKLAEDVLRTETNKLAAYIDKRRHLLTPTAAPAAAPGGSAHQGDRPSHRSSALTNRTTAPVAADAPTAPDHEVTGEDRRRRSLRKMREAKEANAT